MKRDRIIPILGIFLMGMLIITVMLVMHQPMAQRIPLSQVTPSPTQLLNLLQPDAQKGWVQVPGVTPISLLFSPGDPGIGYLCTSTTAGKALLTTNDGGKTWAKLPALPHGAGCVRQISSIDPHDLLIEGIGKPSALAYHSRDGGQTWTKIASPFTASDSKYFLTILDAVFLGNAFVLSVSQDGASDDTKYFHADHIIKITPTGNVEIPSPLKSRDIGYFFGIGTTLFVGSDCAAGCAIYASSNEGATWTSTSLSAGGSDRLDYYLVSSQRFLIHEVFTGNVFLTFADHQVMCEYSIDKGTTWIPFPQLPLHIDSSHAYNNFTANRLLMTTDGTVYASLYVLSGSGQSGFTYAIYRLTSDGKNWQPIQLPQGTQMFPYEQQDPFVISENRAHHPNALWLIAQQTLYYRSA